MDVGFVIIVESVIGFIVQIYMVMILQLLIMYYWRVKIYFFCVDVGYSFVFSFMMVFCVIFMVLIGLLMNILGFGMLMINVMMNVVFNGMINVIKVVNVIGIYIWINDFIVIFISLFGIQVVLWDQICYDEDDFNVQFDDVVVNLNFSFFCLLVDGQFYEFVGLLVMLIGQ